MLHTRTLTTVAPYRTPAAAADNDAAAAAAAADDDDDDDDVDVDFIILIKVIITGFIHCHMLEHVENARPTCL